MHASIKFELVSTSCMIWIGDLFSLGQYCTVANSFWFLPLAP
jgi:hypothetical protein